MAISPIGNVTYINQNSQASSTQQANALNRADMVNIINKEFEDKLKDIQEVRPAEDSQAVHPDGKGNGGFDENASKEESKDTQSKDTKDEALVKSTHILDIKV